MGWVPKIKRGSTYRASLSVVDQDEVPVFFTEGQFIISQLDAVPAVADITLSQANGKFLLHTFNWIGVWSNLVTYQINDVVKYGTYTDSEGNSRSQLWQAKIINIASAPVVGNNWQKFSQFEIILPDTVTATYSFIKATWRLRVVYSNGDIDLSLMDGILRVN